MATLRSSRDARPPTLRPILFTRRLELACYQFELSNYLQTVLESRRSLLFLGVQEYFARGGRVSQKSDVFLDLGPWCLHIFLKTKFELLT